MPPSVKKAEKERQAQPASSQQKPNPIWFKPVMFGLMLLGLAWIIVYYISGSNHWPIPPLEAYNILIGFGITMIGFLMTTRWR